MNSYTIFLLKDDIADPEEALDSDKEYDVIPLTDALGLPGAFFLGEQNTSTPGWIATINPFLEQPIAGLYTASVSAVLIVQYQDRFFALTYGHGKSLLQPYSWVRDFGLKVTLNRVDPSKLRSVDSKIYDEMVVMTRKQTSQSSKVDSFELDIGRALLRGVTGEADKDDIFTRISGSGPLHVSTELDFSRLPDILDEILEAFTDDAYQQNFGWVDNVKEVEPALRADLDQALILTLAAGQLDGLYISAPEILDWEDIHRFSYTSAGQGIVYPELSLQAYLAILANRGIPIATDVLKRHRVRVQYEADDSLHDRWSVYECLVCEIAIQNRRYVLLDGLWFEIAPAFAVRVSQFVNLITSDSIQFPNAILGQREGDYNKGMEIDNPDVFAMLDRELFAPTDAASQIEFCDLLSVAGHIIHVKKRSSSGTLSHLFSQGSVSADLFLQDPPLRVAVNQRLIDLGRPAQADIIPPDRPNSADYEVVFAIIAEQGHGVWPPPLPFFSAVNLMHHGRRIQNLGYSVSLQYILQA